MKVKSFKVNASILEDGLVDEVKQTIIDNPELFEDSEVVLMPDTHKTGGVPVGFTMTVPHKRIAPDFISSDIACGMTSFLIKNWQPTKNELKTLSFIIRDLVQVNKRWEYDGNITDLGTLGGGNHFLEIGVNGNDTLITVHSGSRGVGGEVFKKWKKIAREQYKDFIKEIRTQMLNEIEPKDRQEWLKKHKPLPRKIDFIDLSFDKDLEKDFIRDYVGASHYAYNNRVHILSVMLDYFGFTDSMYSTINCFHNYIDFDEETWVIRKGSIKAVKGETVIIPINMRDGIVIGKVSDRGEFNNSLPHGAGRILSRTKAFEKLNIEQFKEDMKDVISSTIVQETLDESPRAYKDIESILNDIGNDLTDIRVFKSVFNYKGIDKK